MMIQETIYTLINDLKQMMALRQLRIERTRSIDNALQMIHNRYDVRNSLGFDQNYIRLEAAELIEPFLYGGATPAPEALANLFAENFRINASVSVNLAERLYPMMRDFVYLLESGTGITRLPMPIQRAYTPAINPFYSELTCTTHS